MPAQLINTQFLLLWKYACMIVFHKFRQTWSWRHDILPMFYWNVFLYDYSQGHTYIFCVQQNLWPFMNFRHL